MGNEKHRVFIQSYDGWPQNTTVTTEGGEQLQPTSATIWMQGGEPHRVDLTFLVPSIDVKAKVDTVNFACPICETDLHHMCNPGDIDGQKSYFLDWMMDPQRDADDEDTCPDKGNCEGCKARREMRRQVRGELSSLRQEGFLQ